MSKTGLTRHEICERTLQAPFPLDFNADLTRQDVTNYTLIYDNREIVSEDGEDLVPMYLDLLVSNICGHKTELDEVITNHLSDNWSMRRLAEIDIVTLCLTIFEMLYVSDVSNIVTLNEVVELSKRYSGNRPHKFVNSVLSSVVKETGSEAQVLNLFLLSSWC